MHVVGFPRIGPDVEEGEDGHFNSDEQSRDADCYIGLSEFGGRFDGTGGVEEGENYLVGMLVRRHIVFGK